MSRYFFHVINGEFIPDAQGMECSSLSAAKTQAVEISGSMLRDQGCKIWRTKHFDMYVCDEKQKTKLKLSFTAEVVDSEELIT